MALTNFSLPFGALAQTGTPWGATVSPLHPIHQQLAASTNNLLYSPADHQQQPGDSAPPPPGSDFFKNNPYAPPQQPSQPIQTSYQYNSNNNGRRKNTYLPPIPPPGARNTQQQQFHNQQQQKFQHHQQFSHINTHHQQQQTITQTNLNNNNNNNVFKTAISSATASATSIAQATATALSNSNTNTRTYGEGTYTRFPQAPQIHNSNNNNNNNNNINKDHQQKQPQLYNNFPSTPQQQPAKRINSAAATSSVTNPSPSQTFTKYGVPSSQPQPNPVATPAPSYSAAPANKADNSGLPTDSSSNDPYPERPPGFTRVQAGQGSKTRVHAVLDYDLEEGEEDEYYDAEDHGEPVNKDGLPKTPMTVTPIQGPIYLKNGTVPVVPLFHYPSFNNGSFVQIPIWWTALSVALGLDVRGDLIKGVPCIKRYHQLFCPTAGNSYPIDKIERFIDDNKALMRRMYGDFEMNMSDGGPRQQTKKRKRRFIDEPDIFLPPGVYPTFEPDDKAELHAEEQGESYFGKLRSKRQSANQGNRNAKQTQNTPGNGSSSTGRLDACESKIEIVTPYWASNSAGKIRAIVNTQHFEQAIHQEICSKAQTSRCQGECGCEQKYKWHRLLAYDPDNDCKGIFMDWFLFPSCCVCRCNP